MLLRPILLSLCCALPICATPALADFEQTVSDHILPGYADFAAATQALSDEAAQNCKAEGLKPGFNAAYDAWLGVQHLRFGPAEADGHSVAIAFWPDPKGSGAKAQRGLLLGDPLQLTPAHFPDQSVAARGLTGLERLLYPAEPLPADPCDLIRATTLDLARIAHQINEAWLNGYAKTVLTAGAAGNTTYQTRPEVRQVMFTQIVAGLEFDKDQRLARPLGTFDKPRPERAEAVASGRSLRNVLLSLQALRAMVVTLTPDAPQTLAGFDRAITQAKSLNDPVFAGVATPGGRLKVEILQQAIAALDITVLAELGPELDVGIGFNAADGD
ncbi:signal peptidase [Cypionkella aquatica]|uniref:Signal peptidase n=1 Tax=Cypionkella aquatica TaxID=1756042 RepID=A0AA37TRA1_9RHOB|nr:imelysin family protein [Cypionkella aquatica]GLS85888.1 signal peptidase [Cypionkella aquatica]